MTGTEMPKADAATDDSVDFFEEIPVTAHTTFFLCAAAVSAFLGWAWVGTLDIVSMAQGEVVPSTQIKTIQHLEGGIVGAIRVGEGSQVTEGQELIVLEPTASRADVGELRVRLTALGADIARLEALAKGLERPVFPDELADGHPAIVKQSLKRFDTKRRRFHNELERQKETVSQRKHEVREITARIHNARQNLKLLNEQVGISETLLKENLTNRFKHLELLRDARHLKGQIEADSEGVLRADAAWKAAKAELENITDRFDEENENDLDAVSLEFRELTERMKKFQDSLKRTIVRSPVDGTIKTLHVFTVGGVVRPGDPIVEIVPKGDRLIVEAKLQTSDIGYVAEGQPAVVKLASADAMRFGGLDGTVINVSPDTLMTPEGSPFYKVQIATEANHFKRGALRLDLLPGMQVVTSIKTGKRTVMEYVLTPLRYAMSGAIQER